MQQCFLGGFEAANRNILKLLEQLVFMAQPWKM